MKINKEFIHGPARRKSMKGWHFEMKGMGD